jgi:hypothetical protein
MGSESAGIDRRQFLARAGVLGAASVLPSLIPGRIAAALSRADPVLDALSPVLQQVSRDTISGLVAFVVPGPDPYSTAQGVTTSEPGGIDAKGADFLLDALDHFFPLPDEVLRPVVQALGTALSDTKPGLLPPNLLNVPVDLVHQLDDALGTLLRSNDTVPLSIVVALFLNFLATMVQSSSLVGPFPASPFANLSSAEKAEAFRTLEQDTASVVARVDANLSEPARQTLSGVLAFLAGALLEFAAFGSYSEWSAFDPATRAVNGVPVGWRLSGYLSETGFVPVNGWDEFLGYFENRTQVSG